MNPADMSTQNGQTAMKHHSGNAHRRADDWREHLAATQTRQFSTQLLFGKIEMQATKQH